MGYQRDTFYEVKRAFQICGVAKLVEQRRGPRNPPPNRVPVEVETRILDFSLQQRLEVRSISRISCALRA